VPSVRHCRGDALSLGGGPAPLGHGPWIVGVAVTLALGILALLIRRRGSSVTHQNSNGKTPQRSVRSLILAVIAMALDTRVPIARLRGVPFSDPAKDAPIESLEPFSGAVHAIQELPLFADRFGASEAHRVALSFVYQYFDGVESVVDSDSAFESLWNDLIAEIDEPNWVTRGVANLRYFKTDTYPLLLGDGVSLRGRSFTELASMGFQGPILDRITEDWSGFGASSFVLIAEHRTPKKPGNAIQLDTAHVWSKAVRSLEACRLAGPGSISIGPMWVVRASRFNIGTGGLSRVGASIPAPPGGKDYVWSETTALSFPRIYSGLTGLEASGDVAYRRAPGNLAVALRSFMATYDRWPASGDSQLLDTVTALEALLGSETEISFRLSFRVASLLAADDAERASLLTTIKGYYDARSRVVHGVELKSKQINFIEQRDVLLSHLRRLLRAFVRFAEKPPSEYNRGTLAERLDAILLSGQERDSLRAALGLDSD
jgi:hypothetical protein